jgi:hypothetical protein
MFLPIVFTGALLLYSYYYYTQENKSIVNKLWGAIRPPLKHVYYGSIFLAATGFLITLGYLWQLTTQPKLRYKVLLGLFMLTIASLFWMPLALAYLKNKSAVYKYGVIGTLITVALYSFYSLSYLREIQDNTIYKEIAVYGMTYFFIHTFFFDTLLWSYNFF